MYSQVRKTAKCSGVYNLEARRASELQNIPKYMNLSDVHSLSPELEQHQNQQQQQLKQQSDCNSDSSTLETGSTTFYYKFNLNQEANLNTAHFGAPKEDLDKIEIISLKSLRLKDIDLTMAANIISDSGIKYLISELESHSYSNCHQRKSSMWTTNQWHANCVGYTRSREKIKGFKACLEKVCQYGNIEIPRYDRHRSDCSKANLIRGEYDLVDKTATFFGAVMMALHR